MGNSNSKISSNKKASHNVTNKDKADNSIKRNKNMIAFLSRKRMQEARITC